MQSKLTLWQPMFSEMRFGADSQPDASRRPSCSLAKVTQTPLSSILFGEFALLELFDEFIVRGPILKLHTFLPITDGRWSDR